MPQISVSMQDFLRTGEFGPIKLGISHTELQGYLGDPKNWGPYPKAKQHAGIWKYGDIEFHFHFKEDALVGIFSDHVETLNGGNAINLDPWIFHGGLLAFDALERLAAAISYERIHWTLDDDTERYWVGAGVELLFADETKHLFCDHGIPPEARPGMTFDGFSFHG